MRLDYELAQAELATAWEALAPHVGVEPPLPPQVHVRLLDLAGLVAHHPLIRDAATAACARPSWDHDALATSTLAQVRPLAARASSLGHSWDRLIKRLYEQHGGDHRALKETLKSANRRQPWLGAERDVGWILRDGIGRAHDLDLIDCERLRSSVLPVARNGVDALRDLDSENVDDLLAEWDRLGLAMGEVLDAHHELAQLAQTMELAPTLTWLVRLDARAQALRTGQPGALPLAADDPLRQAPVRGAIQSVARLVSASRVALSAGASRRHVVRRLTTFLERFEGASLSARIGQLPGGARPEAVVQDAVDRFVFAEGLFPITHCVAGAGEIDTFVEPQDALVDEADRGSEPAILLELKQIVRPPLKSADRLRAVVKHALGQADHYRKHLAVRPRWRDHEVHVVVVYGGPRRYRVDRGDVALAYVGDAEPSKGSDLVEV